MLPKISGNKQPLIIFVGLLFLIIIFFWWQFFQTSLAVPVNKGESLSSFTKIFSNTSDFVKQTQKSITDAVKQRAVEMYNQEQAKNSLARAVADNLLKASQVNFISPWVKFVYPTWWEIKADSTGQKFIAQDVSSTSTQPVVFNLDFISIPKGPIEDWVRRQYLKDPEMQQFTKIIFNQAVSSSTAYLISQAGSQKVKQIVVAPLAGKIAIIKADFTPLSWSKDGERFIQMIKSFQLP